MTKKKKRSSKRPLKDPQEGSFGLSFGALLKQSGVELPKQKAGPSVAVSAPPPSPQQEIQEFDFSYNEKIVLRRETKRRGGKTVTLVRGLELSMDELMMLAQELRRAFGCGASIEESALLLQGDQIERIEKWLREHGAKRIVKG